MMNFVFIKIYKTCTVNVTLSFSSLFIHLLFLFICKLFEWTITEKNLIDLNN